MSISVYILPIFILFAFLCAFFKKVDVYNSFITGVNSAIELLLSIFPYILAVMVASELFEKSGLSDLVVKTLKPLFDFLGVPSELTKLILFKPLSGSGALAMLTEIYQTYGTESYISKCASCIFSSSETVFYVGAIYFSKCKSKKIPSAIAISLISSFLSCIFACLICKLF